MNTMTNLFRSAYFALAGIGFGFIFLFLLPFKSWLYNRFQLHGIDPLIKLIEYFLAYSLPPLTLLISKRTHFIWGLICSVILILSPILYLIILFKFYNFGVAFVTPSIIASAIGIIAGALITQKIKIPEFITKPLLFIPGILFLTGVTLHYISFGQMYSPRIRNEIANFQIPLYENAYQIKEAKHENSSIHLLNYKVDKPCPDISVINFYDIYLKNNNWKTYNLFEDSWTTFDSAKQGKEQSFKSYSRSWIDSKKEKVFFINLMYETPVGIVAQPKEWKKEWLSTQSIYISIQDYDSVRRMIR